MSLSQLLQHNHGKGRYGKKGNKGNKEEGRYDEEEEDRRREEEEEEAYEEEYRLFPCLGFFFRVFEEVFVS